MPLARWMSSNQLRLNARKPQFIWLGTRQQLAKLNLTLSLQNSPLCLFLRCTVLDLYRGSLDSAEITFTLYIDKACGSCYYQLRQKRIIARSLTSNAAVSVVHLTRCSADLTGSIAVPSLLVSGDSDGEAEVGPPGCGATHGRVHQH